jgi:hypothetical protein
METEGAQNTTSRTYHILVSFAVVMKELYGHEANMFNKPLGKAEKGGSPNLCLDGS